MTTWPFHIKPPSTQQQCLEFHLYHLQFVWVTHFWYIL